MGKKKQAKKLARAEHDRLAPVRAWGDRTVVKALGPLAKATDEPPLLALGLGTLALGALVRRPTLAKSGARMVASHLVATGLKTVLKGSVDRTRPNAVKGEPKLGKGHGTEDTDQNAFPSGHTAGAVAVAQAVSHEVPAAGVPAKLLAGAAGALQVPRGAHYASDVVAGAAIGWLAERLAGAALRAGERVAARRATARAEAEVEAHPS